MRSFIQKALKKLSKLDKDQIQSLLMQLSSENERLEGVLNSMTDGVIVLDNEHRVLFLNRSAERFLPYSIQDFEDRIIWEIVDDREIALFFEKSLNNAEKVEEEEFTIEKGGTPITLSFGIGPLVNEGKINGSLILISNITERRKREARLRRAESLASLTTLAAGVAHEIKNPLGSIGIHIQLLQKALRKEHCLEEEKAGKYLEVISEEVERLNGIVVDFLFAVRPMNAQMKSADLNKVVTEFLEFIQFETAEGNIRMETDLQENLPKIELDEKYIKQALLNIVKNAIAAMPEGGRFSVKSYAADDSIHLSLSDTGVGISEENLSKIFEPYYSTREFGSGLGLTVVYKIIREHGGEISLKSKEGKGTTFTISFPVPQNEKHLLDWKGGIE